MLQETLAAGNEMSDVTNSYVWNAESEIKTAGGLNYSYDGDGDRVQKSNGKIYWYGAGSQVLDESDSAGNITDEYVYFGGKRVAHRIVTGNVITYYAEDMLGSSRAIGTSAGAMCYDADFYPYGGVRDYLNTCPQNYKFTGKERDPETNNDDFDARYYASAYGRFLSADWSSTPAPVPYANLTNPQTLNLYAMVSDNPESFADLDGHKLGVQSNTISECATGTSESCDAQGAAAQNPGTAQDQTQDQKSGNKGDTVTVSYYSGKGPNAFGHSGVAVDSDKPVGLEPKNNIITKIVGTLEGILTGVPYGHTSGEVDQIDAGRAPKATATIKITSDQAKNIRTFLKNESSRSDQTYGLASRNCAQFTEAALRAGGVTQVPSTPSPSALVGQLIKNGASTGP